MSRLEWIKDEDIVEAINSLQGKGKYEEVSIDAIIEDVEWLIQQAELTERWEQALKNEARISKREENKLNKRVDELEHEIKQIKTAYDDRIDDIDGYTKEIQRYKQALEIARKSLLKASDAYTDNCDFHVNYRVQEAIVNIEEALKGADGND